MMVSIHDLHFTYRRKKVFNGLSLELKPGNIYGLLGSNGTGKSTLLRNIGGFLFPQKGSIDVLGYTPGKRQPAFLANTFLVPEEFYLPPVRIDEWIKYGAPFYPQFSREQFDRLLTEFEIPQDSLLHEMSYGQRKKALIAFSVATNTALLLMDEPTNGLDIRSKSQFRKVIAGSLDDTKCIVISTHQVKDLENLIDRVTIIDDGKILFDQTMQAISQKLSFRLSFDPEETAHALYKETSLKGNALILVNDDGEDSRPDLEMLYKAVTMEGEQINQLFRN